MNPVTGVAPALLAAALGFALAWVLRSRIPPRRRPGESPSPERPPPALRRVAHADPSGRTLEARCTVLEQLTLEEFVRHLETREGRDPAADRLLAMYRVRRRFPDLGDFRLGPNAFDRIRNDWILLARERVGRGPELIGHGVTTRIYWDGSLDQLPRGWQGAVRRSLEDDLAGGGKANTLVGLFIRVQSRFRQHGWAAPIAAEMKALAARCGLHSLIIPLRLPQRYLREYAEMPFEEFAALRRDDGEYQDHWLRLHTRLGARVLTTCRTSHQHAMHLEDFHQQLDAEPIRRSGTHLARLGGDWVQVYVDLEREFVLMDQGCVWVEHPVGPPPS